MDSQEHTSLLWPDAEISAVVFSDRRHGSRYKSLMQKLWGGTGNTLSFAYQNNVFFWLQGCIKCNWKKKTDLARFSGSWTFFVGNSTGVIIRM